MMNTNRNLILLVLALALLVPATAPAAKKTLSGTFQGKAKALDGSASFGATKFVISKNKLKSFEVTKVPRTCGTREEKMNYGFTVASNVLKAYGLKSSDVKLKKGKLKFTYSQPGSNDKITVKVNFKKKSPSGSVVQKPSSAEKNTRNCEGSAKFSLKKKKKKK